MHFSLVYAVTATILAIGLPLVNAQGVLPNGTYRIENIAFDSLSPPRVLDLFNSSPDPGTPLIVFPNNNTTNQRWNVVQSGFGYTVTAVAPPSNAFVSPITLGGPITGTPSVRTILQFNRISTNNIYQIVVVTGSMAFGVQSTTDGGAVILGLLNSADPRQGWRMVRV